MLKLKDSSWMGILICEFGFYAHMRRTVALIGQGSSHI